MECRMGAGASPALNNIGPSERFNRPGEGTSSLAFDREKAPYARFATLMKCLAPAIDSDPAFKLDLISFITVSERCNESPQKEDQSLVFLSLDRRTWSRFSLPSRCRAQVSL